jgi:hypothetical protein
MCEHIFIRFGNLLRPYPSFLSSTGKLRANTPIPCPFTQWGDGEKPPKILSFPALGSGDKRVGDKGCPPLNPVKG